MYPEQHNPLPIHGGVFPFPRRRYGLFLLAGISYQALCLMADTGQQEPMQYLEKERA